MSLRALVMPFDCAPPVKATCCDPTSWVDGLSAG